MAAGSIVIDLLLSTGSFEPNSKRAEQNLKQLKKEAADFGKQIGLAFAGATTAMAAFVKLSINTADEMSKASQKAGVTVEALSGLKYAADLAGVSFEGLQNGLKKLNTNIFEAAQGSKSQAEAFKTLGINFKDTAGNLKAADQVLIDVAKTFAKMPDGVQKSALAVELFGRAGTDLIPLLNSGSAGIKQLTDEAERLGIVIDTKTAKAAEQFNDNMERLKKSASGLGLELAKKSLPALDEITNAMAEAAREAGILEAAWVGLGGAAALALGKTDFQQNNRKLEEINKQLSLAQKQFQAASLNPEGASDRFFNFLIPDVKLNAKAKATLKSRIDALISERDAILKSMEAPKIDRPTFIPEITPLSSKRATSRGSKGTSLADVQLDFRIEDFQKMGRELEVEGQRIANINNFIADSFEDESKRIKDAFVDDEAIKEIRKLKDEAASIYEATRTPLENFTAQMEKVKELLDKGLITPDTAGREMQQRHDEFVSRNKQTTDKITEFWKQAARNMEDAMGGFFFDVMQGELGDLAGSFKRTIDRMVADMLAARAATALFGENFGAGGELGGFVGDIFKGFNLPSFDVGTPYVPHDMVANIHKGERILTADENRKFSSGQMGGQTVVQGPLFVVNTPNADSFMRSEPQVAAAMQRSLNRGRRIV